MTDLDEKDPYGSNPYGNDEIPQDGSDDFQDKRLTAKETLISAKENAQENQVSSNEEASTYHDHYEEKPHINEWEGQTTEAENLQAEQNKPNVVKEIGKSIVSRILRLVATLGILFIIGLGYAAHKDIFDALGILGKSLKVDGEVKANMKYSWEEVEKSQYDEYFFVPDDDVTEVKLIAKSGSCVFLVVEVDDSQADISINNFIKSLALLPKEERENVAKEWMPFKISEFLINFIKEGDINDKDAVQRAREELYQNLFLTESFEQGKVLSGQTLKIDDEEVYVMEYTELAKDNIHNLQVLNFFKEVNGKVLFFEAYTEKGIFANQKGKLLKALQGLDF